MDEKKFNCKMEDVPVMAGFVFDSFEKDKADFVAFSPVFADPFIGNARTKLLECYEVVTSGDVLKYQKVIKVHISRKLTDLRLSLNKVEGYLKLADGTLDIEFADFGLKVLRTAISTENLEKVMLSGRSLISMLKSNETPLKEKGMTDVTMTELVGLIDDINALNFSHNSKKNERSRAATDSIKMLNELWDITGTILDAGRAIYRGVSDVKLREYTLTVLLKRVHNKQAADAGNETDAPAK